MHAKIINGTICLEKHLDSIEEVFKRSNIAIR